MVKFNQIIKLFLLLAFIFAQPAFANDHDLKYENISRDGHSIHTLTINPKKFKLEIARALNSGLGRESVASIAKRKNAIAAINGGFFTIGGTLDGRSVYNLKINDALYSITNATQGTIGWKENQVLFDRLKIEASIHFNDKTIDIDGFNRLPLNKDEIILYNHHFHNTTLTRANRTEILIQNNQIKDIYHQGDNLIPENAYILSFPKNKQPEDFTKGMSLTVNFEMIPKSKYTSAEDWTEMSYILSGTPLLIANGRILDSEFSDETKVESFLTNNYARTAIGITQKGDWIFVIVDHFTPHNLPMMSISDAVNLLKNKDFTIDQINEMKLIDIQSNLAALAPKKSSSGMTILELAKFMDEKGCIWALNLDGGGSSTLFYKNKIINQPMGDEDEGFGEITSRRVSDAIIVLPK